MPSKSVITLIPVLAVYALLNVYRPEGLMAYFFPITCWSLVALITLRICGPEKIGEWFNKRLSIVAALIAFFQILTLINAGFFTGFGKSPYSFTPTGITINLLFISSTLLGTELSRAYLTKNGKKKPILTLGLITLLYSLITTPITKFLTLINDPLTLTKFLGSQLLPTLAENLLASYLALLAGPIAALAYRFPLKAFHWFSPILPNLPWGVEALLGVMAPTIGFLATSQATTPTLLKRNGIPTETKKPRRLTRTKKSSHLGWMTVSILCVLLVWTSTGLLGFQPTVIIGGSMRPTMDVGDIAIIVQAPTEKIKTGDIIQYWQKEGMVIHRVHDIDQTEGSRLFITKGDANNAPDKEPILPTQIRGKLILTIPKLGWTSIYTKTIITEIWSFLSANTIIAYEALITTISMATIYAIHAHNTRPRYWRRKGGWLKR